MALLLLPKDTLPGIHLCRAFKDLAQEPSAILPWLESEKERLEEDNRLERDIVLNNQRQGVLQAISLIIKCCNTSVDALRELETRRADEEKQQRRNQHELS